MNDIEGARTRLVTLAKKYVQSLPYIDENSLLLDFPEPFIDEFRDQWAEDLTNLQASDNPVTMYHICHQNTEAGILEHGIYHDPSPTLTPNLVGALAKVLYYHQKHRRHSSILVCSIPFSEVRYVKIDAMGLGFLPKATKNEREIGREEISDFLRSRLFKSNITGKAFWLDPKYFHVDNPFFRTSDEAVDSFMKELRREE
jgi:hypothetical protein